MRTGVIENTYIDLRAAPDALFSVRLQRMAELSPAAARIWISSKNFWGQRAEFQKDLQLGQSALSGAGFWLIEGALKRHQDKSLYESPYQTRLGRRS